MRCRLVGFCLFGALLASCAGHREAPLPTDIDETAFRDDIRLLASDEFEGRRPGTRGEEKTLAWLVEQFKKLGLKPINGGSYLQQVPLIERSATGEVSLSVTGHGQTVALAYRKDMVLWPDQGSGDAVLRQSDVVFVGYGIVAPEYSWDDYAARDVHGKTVVVMVNDPGVGSKDAQIFKGGAMSAYGRMRYKIDEAARHGAAAVLLIHDAAAAGYAWNSVVNTWTGAIFGAARPDVALQPPLVAAWLAHHAGRALFAQAGLDGDALLGAASRPGFKAVDLGLKVDAQWHGTVRRVSSANVIGVLPGTRRKHEYVLFAAHWDHLGRAPAELGGGIYPGATDAAGVAGLLALAQSFKRTQPAADRSMVFAAFTGATDGLFGSSYYVQNPVIALADTAAVFNLDELHIGGPTRDVVVFGYGNSELEEYLTSIAQLQGRVVHPDPNPERGYFYESDHFNFVQQGVPALYARGGTDDSARGPTWGQAQIDYAIAHRYRQTTDRYSADWDVRGTLDDLRLYYDVGNRVARTRRFPRWYPNSEFRIHHQHTEISAD